MTEQMPHIGERILFGPFMLSTSERLLTRDGIPIELGARTLDTLIALVSRPNEVVSKRNLMAEIWPDVIVEEGSLRFHIAGLRKALGDGENGARYITTLAGRGYCFVAPASRSAPPPPGKGVSATPPNANFLPARLQRMVGREENILSISTALTTSRFVTIVGPGGVGKTTVAASIGHDMLADFAGAVLFVDFSLLNHPAMVSASVASMLGISVQSDDPVPSLIDWLGDRRLLLILDSCEHVIDGAARLAAAIFLAAPQIHILATSREALRVEGEQVHRLAPLAVPPEDASLSEAQVLAFPAMQLFSERVKANGGNLKFGDSDTAIAAGICRKLDGVPLAIELAAGRVEAFGLRQTADLLDQRLALLWQGQRNAPTRHKTLQATLDWSYELLTPLERTVLQRLAIFVGQFTMDAALAILISEDVDRSQVIGAIDSLVSKSMVATRPVGAMMHYRLLDATRAYALGTKIDSAESSALAARHAHYYQRWLTQTEANGTQLSNSAERASKLAELGNVRAALKWSFGPGGDVAIGTALAAAAAPVFLALSLPSECHRWCERALTALDGTARGGAEEMRLQSALGLSLMFTHSSSERARQGLNRSLEIAEARGDAIEQLQLLAPLHMFHARLGDFKTALHYGYRVAAVSKPIEDPDAFALGHSLLGMSLHLTGQLADARVALDAALSRAPLGSATNVSYLGFNGRSVASAVLARTLWLQGFPDQALAWAHRNVQDAVSTDHPVTLCVALIWAVSVFLWTGDLKSAADNVALFKARARTASLEPYLAVAQGFEGELALRSSDPEQGVDSLESCLVDLRAARYELLSTPFRISLVEGLVVTGRITEAPVLVEEAIAIAEAGGHTSYLPELLRMKSRVLLAMPKADIDGGERSLLQSLDLSRNQTARAWELRTATDLATLRARQGKPEAAHDLLRPIYDGFTEGLDTADLKAARRLLASLHVKKVDRAYPPKQGR
jgi:predicted ATPase/DNA-binding winged helix-turn-helix (wHTH) protein